MDWTTCFEGKKILVVEDDSINRDLMKDILGQMKCQIEFAEDGIIAVQKATSGKYDLIFMDVRMPNKDGVEATKEIKASNTESKNTPIIGLTASVTENRDTLITAGMIDVVDKPLNLQQLREKMSKVLLR